MTHIEDMTREQLVALCMRWERAHCEAGIVGSEYYADPEWVFAAVRSTRESQHRVLVNAVKRARQAEGQL